MKATLTQARLKEVLHYNRATGAFTRLSGPKKGQVAGHVGTDGYVHIFVINKNYLGHRLAYLYVRGRFPVGEVDHRNTVRWENQWSNLRVATSSQNAQNLRKATIRSKTQLLGVSKYRQRYRACIRVDNRNLHIGTFDTPEEAHAAYLAKKREAHPFSTI